MILVILLKYLQISRTLKLSAHEITAVEGELILTY